MKVNLETNALNHLKEGITLFKKNDPISFMGLIIQGSIRIENSGIMRTAKAGDMIGIVDIFASEYVCNYTTIEKTVFYAFPAKDIGSIENFMNSNKDYRGILIDSLTREFLQYIADREYLLNWTKEMVLFLKRHYDNARKEGMREVIPEEFLETLPEDILEIDYDEQKILFYQDCAVIPLEVKKKYYQDSDFMALYQAEEISGIIREVQKTCKETVEYIKKSFFLYINDQGECLFDKEVRFAMEMKKTGKFQMEHFLRIGDTKQKIIEIANSVKQRTGEELNYNVKYIDEQMDLVMMAPVENIMDDDDSSDMEENNIDTYELLQDSLSQILKYAGIDVEKQKNFIYQINSFIGLNDRFAATDDVRLIKKSITNLFYEIYKNCLYRWFENKNVALPIKLFLYYGYVDERLLDREHLAYLSSMANEKDTELPFKIYHMPEWLEEIYEGNKDTSRNAFERDYRDELREEKRIGRITDKEEKELLQDKKRRVDFEIDNMFASNNKIVNGKLSTFVPILYKEEFYGSIERIYLTKTNICDAILDLEMKDFTIFYREVLYQNADLKIDREHLMKHVYPDIIVAPIYGIASSMWQEITGKKRDTPARFIFPAFCEVEVDKIVTKAFGRFHWEYCRCSQGTAWNNIQIKSLTSEYMDYIQYYRKNHDLTEEKRDKIRTQIQRARNNSREIFLSDYENWIYSESKSALKLNKVAREILATYCPFSKAIREKLKTNIAFAEAMSRQQRNYLEKVHEWELRIRRRENNGLEVPEEYQQTLEYYANK